MNDKEQRTTKGELDIRPKITEQKYVRDRVNVYRYMDVQLEAISRMVNKHGGLAVNKIKQY